MLSAFPVLFSWSELSPFLLRLTIGAVFLFWAYKSFKDRDGSTKRLIGIGEGLVGILFIIGMWTQIAALAAIVDLGAKLLGKFMKRAFLTDGVNYYLILFIIAVSLLFTGAGILGIDYRL